jgi:hypothetical protein
VQYAVNIMGVVVAALCAVLLLRAYIKVRQRLLLWSGLCFAGLTLANAFLIYDLAVVPNVSFYPWRLCVAALSMIVLVYGLVFESD